MLFGATFEQPVAATKSRQLVTTGGFEKKWKLMEFSIKLAGWVLNDPGCPLKKNNMVLKHFILPVEHFKLS